MREDENIFNKVIKSENQFSQLLVNLLNYDDRFKEIFESFFELKGKIGKVDNQKRNKNGQPDIRFNYYDLSNNLIGHVIIEVKTKDYKLTDNQPSGYISELLSNDYKSISKHLFF